MPRRAGQIHFLLACMTAVVAGCGNGEADVVQPGATACGAGEAKILVLDGLQQRLCGCAEAAAVIAPPTTMTCTIASGTRIFIDYSPSVGPHQIVPSGTPALMPSPVSRRQGGVRLIQAHTFVLSASGTYAFTDAFNGSISGQFVVP